MENHWQEFREIDFWFHEFFMENNLQEFREISDVIDFWFHEFFLYLFFFQFHLESKMPKVAVTKFEQKEVTFL